MPRKDAGTAYVSPYIFCDETVEEGPHRLGAPGLLVGDGYVRRHISRNDRVVIGSANGRHPRAMASIGSKIRALTSPSRVGLDLSAVVEDSKPDLRG